MDTVMQSPESMTAVADLDESTTTMAALLVPISLPVVLIITISPLYDLSLHNGEDLVPVQHESDMDIRSPPNTIP
jgi:hypothetical protein